MGFESEFKFFKKKFKTVKFWSRPIIHDQFYTENLPILGGQKAAVSDSVNGWCAAGNIVQTDGERDDRDLTGVTKGEVTKSDGSKPEPSEEDVKSHPRYPRYI